MLKQLLETVKSAVPSGDEGRVLESLEDHLLWLSDEADNTHRNRVEVDTFFCTEVWPLLADEVPEPTRELIEDIGGALHDTHAAPSVAQNFQSTPDMLLAGVQERKASGPA